MDYPNHLLTNLSKMYIDMTSSHPDITLHCIEDGTKLKCHRIVLSASSEYFKNVFGWSESDVLDVHNEITGETMQMVLKFIYSGKISLTKENVNDILIAANFFSILHIVELCSEFLLNNLEVGSCLEMLLFSWQLDLSELTETIAEFVARNFTEIMDDLERVSSIPVELMGKVLKLNDLVIRNKQTKLPTRPVEREKGVLDFILTYTKNLDQCSKDDIQMLFSCIKWQFFDIFEEKDNVLSEFGRLGRFEEEIAKCLQPTTHSEWFTQSFDNSFATAEDKKNVRYTCFQLFRAVLDQPYGRWKPAHQRLIPVHLRSWRR